MLVVMYWIAAYHVLDCWCWALAAPSTSSANCIWDLE